jgi:hypothetical protein
VSEEPSTLLKNISVFDGQNLTRSLLATLALQCGAELFEY